MNRKKDNKYDKMMRDHQVWLMVCKVNSDLTSATHSVSRACTSFVFCSSGLIFSGVIASLRSERLFKAGRGGIDLTDPVFGALGSLDDVVEGETTTVVSVRAGRVSFSFSSTLESRVGRGASTPNEEELTPMP